ncbi:MAG: carboxypeptidase regulatory-like domain-containing protein [Phycisphaerae bacterium]|nr:carboxypeptidase regulatory-like domain-containing protein [Phycisphaerae bacterium]
MNSENRCQDQRELIAALVMGELDSALTDRLQKHMAHCKDCHELYEALCSEEEEIRSTFETISTAFEAMEEGIVENMKTSRTAHLKSSGDQHRTARIIRIVVPIAAAAVLVIAAVIAAKLLIEDNDVEYVIDAPGDSGSNVAIAPQQAVLATELKTIEQMFASNDSAGLVSVLDRGLWESKIVAAKYLGQIGDERALATLSSLLNSWEGEAADNPFGAAIEEIESRVGASEPNETELESAPPEETVVAEQSSFKFEARGVLSGLVTDVQTGEPIVGAEVRASISRIYNAKTDANGFYSIDKINKDGNYRISVASKGYLGITDYDKMPIINLRKDSREVKHFKFARACMIEVKVVDDAGKPIEGADLVATSLADDRSRAIGERSVSRETDANGIIVLGGFAPSETGSYQITARHSRTGKWVEKNGRKYRESVWDYAPSRLVVKLSDPSLLETGTIVMKKGIEVAGYAEYSDGVPAEGLRISPRPDWWHTNYSPESYPIDANGLFIMPQIAEGMYNIYINFPHADGGGSMSYSVLQTKLPLAEGELLVVKIPRKSPGSLVSISGKVIFTTEKRPDNYEVSAYSPQGGHHDTRLGPNQDTFEIDSLEPGLYTLRFSGTNVEEKVIKNVKAPGSGLEVELEYMDKPKLTGTVVLADSSEPPERFRARVRKLKTHRGPNYVIADRWTEFKNSQGQFSIEVVGPGIYQVQVAAEALAWGWSEKIDTDLGEPVVIKLHRGGSIEGTVVDEQGLPVAGASVIPLSKACGTMPRVKDVFVSEAGAVETDAAGRFTLNNLAAGTETLKVNHEDYTFNIVKGIEVSQDEVSEDVEIVLSRGGAVEGYVYDYEGKPQPNVTLLFQDDTGYGGGSDEEAGRFATAITDANGFYHVSRLPERMCYVRRSNSGGSLGVIRRSVLPQNGVTARLDFGGDPVVFGRMIVDATPLANARVILGDSSSPYWGVHKCIARTDAQGRFSFPGTPVGRYGIYYEQPDKRGKWVKVAVIETQTVDMDLGVIPGPIGTVRISIAPAEPNEPLPQGLNAYLQTGTRYYALRAGTLAEPKTAGDPYIVTNILPGIYTATVRRSDGVRFRERVEFTEEQAPLDVTLTIPKCTASIGGMFRSETDRSLVMWRSDGKVVASIIPENGRYAVKNLPAGDYAIGRSVAPRGWPLVEFGLAEGESKTLDLDPVDWPVQGRGRLIVQAVDSGNGIPLTAARMWLSRSGEIFEAPTTSSQGHVFDVPPGDYVLHAECIGYQEAEKAVEIGHVPSAFIRLNRER